MPFLTGFKFCQASHSWRVAQSSLITPDLLKCPRTVALHGGLLWVVTEYKMRRGMFATPHKLIVRRLDTSTPRVGKSTH